MERMETQLKLGRRNKQDSDFKPKGINQTKLNKSVNIGKLIAVIAITAGLIVWTAMTGKKAEETVQVAMLNQAMYKNQILTEDMLVPYDMLAGEYEKYGVKNDSGKMVNRLVLWDKRDKYLNSFAAYPIQRETLLDIRSLVKSRTDNTDSVLYSFPGKEIVQLDISGSDLNSFKTFIRPGDRLNIDAIYSEKATIQTLNADGSTNKQDVDVFKTEPVFSSIMIADMINDTGESVLDKYESYNQMTVVQQATLDRDETWKDSTTPKALLVALTPEEKESYYRYLSKNNISFKVSLPQRIE